MLLDKIMKGLIFIIDGVVKSCFRQLGIIFITIYHSENFVRSHIIPTELN